MQPDVYDVRARLRKRNARPLAFLIFLLLSAVSSLICQTGRGTPITPTQTIEPTLEAMARLMLNQSDVPDSWYDNEEFYPEDVLNAVSLSHSFRGSGDESEAFIQLSQYLTVYVDDQSALDAYRKQQVLFDQNPQAWQEVANLAYLSRADKFRFMCTDEVVNLVKLKSCTIFQLYGRYLSIIYVNVEGKYITFDQVQQVLGRVDDKLAILKQ
jgi:hypothetical protein